MESRFETIRNSIYRRYEEDYLKQILIDFCMQQLNLSDFNIENRNISKILNHFFEDLIYRAKSKNGKYSPNDIINNDELLKIALDYIEQHRSFYQQKSDNYYEIQMNESKFCEAFLGFTFDKEKKQYILISLRFIEWVYDCQPEEVITATLKESALSAIGVDRKNLKIEKQYRLEGGQMDIYSLQATDAQERTKKILESEGCRKIIIGSTIPDMLEDDKGYHVSYSCERPFEKVNILEKPKK